MFVKLAAVVSIALFAVAFPTPSSGGQCNTGELQCCNSVTSANDPSAAGLLDSLGVVAQGVTGQVGLSCSPVNVLGIGSTGCQASPVCCTNNTFNGLIALGCIPVSVNL